MTATHDELRIMSLYMISKAKEGGDPEEGHMNADAVLCVLLTELGFADVVEAWNTVDKWYA